MSGKARAFAGAYHAAGNLLLGPVVFGALLAVLGSGNEIVKSPFVAVFAPPKSKTTTNLSPWSSLYIAA